jgi:hypothetical protein
LKDDEDDIDEVPCGSVFAHEGQVAGHKRRARDYARTRSMRAGRYQPATVEDGTFMQDVMPETQPSDDSQTSLHQAYERTTSRE